MTRGTGINGMKYYYLGVRPAGNIQGPEFQLYDYSTQLSSGFTFKDTISQLSSIQLPIYNIKLFTDPITRLSARPSLFGPDLQANALYNQFSG